MAIISKIFDWLSKPSSAKTAIWIILAAATTGILLVFVLHLTNTKIKGPGGWEIGQDHIDPAPVVSEKTSCELDIERLTNHTDSIIFFKLLPKDRVALEAISNKNKISKNTDIHNQIETDLLRITYFKKDLISKKGNCEDSAASLAGLKDSISKIENKYQ